MKSLLTICVFALASNFSFAAYTEQCCLHKRAESTEEFRALVKDSLAYDQLAYNCWVNSDIQKESVGRITPEKLMNLVTWIENEDIHDLSTFFRRVSCYIEPNEEYPCLATAFYKRGTGRPLLSVGTERGFMAAGVAKASSLYLFDYDADVAVYNWINLILLKAANDRAHYFELRLKASLEDWLDAFSKNDEISALFSNEDLEKLYSYWNTNVTFRLNTDDRFLKEFYTFRTLDETFPAPFAHLHYNQSTPLLNKKITFEDGSEVSVKANKYANFNYLYDDSLFKRVKELADQNKVYIYLGDLTDPDQVKNIVNDVLPQQFGVIDTSNALDFVNSWDNYSRMNNMSYKKFLGNGILSFLETMSPATDKETWFVWTTITYPSDKALYDFYAEMELDFPWSYETLNAELLYSALDKPAPDVQKLYQRAFDLKLSGCQ